MQKQPSFTKARPRMHKLLILEYDYNQKIWYQKESLFSIIETSYLVYWIIYGVPKPKYYINTK